MSKLEKLTEDFGVTLKHMAEQSYKPMTNGDHIRAMSDDELAEFLNRVKQPCDNCQLAVVEGACTETLCDDAMEKWLKQPVEDDEIIEDCEACKINWD